MIVELQNINYQTNPPLALVIIGQENALNTINLSTINELKKVFSVIKQDSSIRVVILTGAGKDFVTGLQEQELNSLSAQSAKVYAEEGQALILEITQLGKPVIAAINGLALDIGLELAAACSLRIASETAQFGLPLIKKGKTAAFGGVRRLIQLIGLGKTLELLLTGDLINAQKASEIGLINLVTRPMDLFSSAKEMAQRISNNSPIAIKYLLESVYNGLEMPLEEALLLEATLFGLCSAAGESERV
jgi:enoyl-CoA hydratase